MVAAVGSVCGFVTGAFYGLIGGFITGAYNWHHRAQIVGLAVGVFSPTVALVVSLIAGAPLALSAFVALFGLGVALFGFLAGLGYKKLAGFA